MVQVRREVCESTGIGRGLALLRWRKLVRKIRKMSEAKEFTASKDDLCYVGNTSQALDSLLCPGKRKVPCGPQPAF